MEEQYFFEQYTHHLNDNQVKAVRQVDGPVLVLAVPGSGKTTVLVTRLGYMIYCKKVSPENVLTLTYTVAATNDMRKRFETIFGDEYADRLEFRTINGICSKIINRYAEMKGREAFDLVTDERIIGKVLTDILSKLLLDYPTESDVKSAKTLIAYCKNMMLSEEEIIELGNSEGIPLYDIYKEYNSYLIKNKLMDYDDQMRYAFGMLRVSETLLNEYRNMYRYICVDEAQDTSKIQHVIIRLLAGENGNLFMVGDEDQSIYGFRAAYPEALLNFSKDFTEAKVIVMDQNYRSNANIVSGANLFIKKNASRYDKNMCAAREASNDIKFVKVKTRAYQYGSLIKVAQNCTSETAVLYRENESILPLIDRLDRYNIPYRIRNIDMTFFTHRVVVDVTNIIKFAMNPYDTELFLKIYYKCQTYLNKYQAEKMCKISAEQNIPVLEAAKFVSGINGMVLGKCKALGTHMKNMMKESPQKALYRIENFIGYKEYLDRKNIDPNKLYILNQLSYAEYSLNGYIRRLEYLNAMLKDKKTDYNCKFILSTIHGSKGLEYEDVYLMDICDGVFPTMNQQSNTISKEKKAFEEERRIFYVGMTRAKNNLFIFDIDDEESTFIDELKSVRIQNVQKSIEIAIGQKEISKNISDNRTTIKETADVSNSTSENESGRMDKNLVHKGLMEKVQNLKASSGTESGEDAHKDKTSSDIYVEKRKKNRSKRYTAWMEEYPGYIIIKKEGYFWSARGESAKKLNELLGFNLGGSDRRPVTGSPSLKKITDGLDGKRVSYIVVADDKIKKMVRDGQNVSLL